MHRTSNRFWKSFHELPAAVQSVAEENFDLLKRNPRHPSLHFKRVGKFWSARAGLDHRGLAVKDGLEFYLVMDRLSRCLQKVIKARGLRYMFGSLKGSLRKGPPNVSLLQNWPVVG